MPIAQSVATTHHTSIVGSVSAMPHSGEFFITKRDVTRMNAAQPFMLIVQQSGRMKRAIQGFACRFDSAVETVTGSVAAELFVKSAINSAGVILCITL